MAQAAIPDRVDPADHWLTGRPDAPRQRGGVEANVGGPVLFVHEARFRVLNGSNVRTYRLVLLGDGAPELHRITQIGTDHGLLRAPASLPGDGLLLASAERADLLVDFSGLAPGSELTLLNAAAAPFGRLTKGMAWLTSAISVGTAAGPAAAGEVIAAGGARWGYAFAAACRAASALVDLSGLTRLTVPAPHPSPAACAEPPP
jgi:FtsP/CotA-like multicopper oxidase with cupredoxin domain